MNVQRAHSDSHSMDENNEYAQSCHDAVMEAAWKDDDHNKVCGGANSYKTTDGKVIFLTQAESYHVEPNGVVMHDI